MYDLLYPVGYLERSDFSENGELLNFKEPVFIMIQTGVCGACIRAKPLFQKLANNKVVQCMTIQLDGQRQSEKELAQMIDKIYPDLMTVPNYVLYLSRNKKVLYEGDRSYESLVEFVEEHL